MRTALVSRSSTEEWTSGSSFAVFLFAAIVAGGTVAGPGLSWDEPAYRHSQVTLQSWGREIVAAPTLADKARLFSADAIRQYWEFNRFGHNFHPPMASYFNLLTFTLFGGFIDDISARRLASALLFAATAALAAHAAGSRWGRLAGWIAGLSLLFMPRVMGDAHVIGTDVPMLFFWAATALAFLKGFESRRWQVIAAFLFACLFLVKFSAVAILPVLLGSWIAKVASVAARNAEFPWRRLLLGSALFFGLAAVLLGVPYLLGMIPEGGKPSPLAAVFRSASSAYVVVLLLPPVLLAVFRRRQPAVFRDSAGWHSAVESLWTLAALAPVFAIGMNPTWWHDPATSLADYLNLSFARQDKLPDIGVFYLGKRYLYSLPWHNAFVLTFVTVPFGTLALAFAGLLLVCMKGAREPALICFAVHALTLPVMRMLNTPAHDGVRLFLPTFFFLAVLAGHAASRIVKSLEERSRRAARVTGVLLLGLGPVWSAWEWVRIHPHELSYYNLGLRRAVDAGFETTYWYDAVTPAALRDLNARLPEAMGRLSPRGAVVGFPDPKINPDVFVALVELGRLSAEIPIESRGIL